MRLIKQNEALLIVLWLFACPVFSQKSLQITFMRFGSLKKKEISINDRLDYKLKGQTRYRKGIIANLQDSLIIFNDESAISLNEIKCLRFRKKNTGFAVIEGILIQGAIFYPLLTTVNNALNHNPPYLREGAAIVSASMLGACFILYQLQIKRIRITRNKTIKILDINYQRLSEN